MAMSEVAVFIGKLLTTIVSFMAFILGLLVGIDPSDIGIKLLEVFKVAIPSPMIDGLIMELRILGAVLSLSGFVVFLLSIFFLWRD